MTSGGSPQAVDAAARVRRPRPRRLRPLVSGLCLAAVALYAAATPVLTAIGGQLVRSDALRPVDAIIVLAPWLDRILEASELYRAGYAPVIVLTREVRQPAEQLLIDRGILTSGEERRRDALLALGVPRDAVVILDDFVGSTIDEARAFARWAAGRSIRSVIVVTSPFHTGRSQLTFRRLLEGHQTEVLIHPSTLGTPFESSTWWKSRNTLRDGIFEWQKLVYYRLVELP